MSELKTLKDLEYEKYFKGNPDTRIYSWRLKQEAIKWIKFSKIQKLINLENEDYQLALAHETTIIFIKKFFNVEEEDLK